MAWHIFRMYICMLWVLALGWESMSSCMTDDVTKEAESQQIWQSRSLKWFYFSVYLFFTKIPAVHSLNHLYHPGWQLNQRCITFSHPLKFFLMLGCDLNAQQTICSTCARFHFWMQNISQTNLRFDPAHPVWIRILGEHNLKKKKKQTKGKKRVRVIDKRA